MNPAGISTKKDSQKAREEYINNLRLQSSNLQKTKNALDVLETTGSTPTRPTDNKTQLEKYADIQQIKIDLSENLKQIMDGTNATHVLSELGKHKDELYYVANHISELINFFQKRYQLGTPAVVFLTTIRKMMKKKAKEVQDELGFKYTAKDDDDKGNPRKSAGGGEDDDDDDDEDDDDDDSKPKRKGKTAKKGVDKEKAKEKRAIKQEKDSKVKRQEEIDKRRAGIPDPMENIYTEREEVKKESAKKGVDKDKAKIKREEKQTAGRKEKRQEEIEKRRAIEIQNSYTEREEVKKESAKKGVDKDKAKQRRETKKAETRSDTRKKIIDEKRANMPIDEIPEPEDEPINLSVEQMREALLNHMNETNQTKLQDPSSSSGFRYKSQIRTLRGNRLLKPLYDLHITQKSAQKASAGSGLAKKAKKSGNIIFGGGISVHHKKVDFDTSKAVIPKETYSQFGRYIINNHKLSDDIIMLRSKKGSAIPYLPTQKVSKKLIQAVSKIVNGGSLDYDDINQLNDDEREHLHTIVNKSQLGDKFKIPQNCEVDKENNRFEILKGEILAGNNSPSAIKEFKLLIVKLMNKNRLPRRQGQEILTDLTTLGF